MFPESPRKDLRGKSCWLHRRESSREVQGPGGATISSTLLGPVLVWKQQNYLKLLLIVRYARPHKAAASATLPKGKAGKK